MFKWSRPGWLLDMLARSTDSVEFTKGRSNALLQRWTLNLNAAGNQTVSLAGNFVYGYEGTDTIANVNLQFSRRDTDQDFHPLVEGFGYIHPFDKLHISWDAQPGKTLEILIGSLAPELLNIIDNRSAIAQAALLQEIIDELEIQTEKLNEGLPRTARTRVEENCVAGGAVTVILYTVPANKVLYLSGASVDSVATALSITYLKVRNGADVMQYVPITLAFSVNFKTDARNADKSYSPAIKIPAGYDITLENSAAAGNSRAFIHGWLEDA